MVAYCTNFFCQICAVCIQVVSAAFIITASARNVKQIAKKARETTSTTLCPTSPIPYQIKEQATISVISGVKEGRLKVTCGDFFDKTYSADSEGSPAIYSFTDIYTCWQKETPLTAEISFTYTSNRGTLWDITQSQTIQFRRNVMTTVNVRLTPDLSGGLFELEEEPLDEENIIDMGINTDGLIDIIVNPES